MKEVVIRSWCDACDALDEEVRNESEHSVAAMLSPVGARPKSLDLCERHYKELVEPLEKLLRSHGAHIDASKSALPGSLTPRPTTYAKKEEPVFTCGRCPQTGGRRATILHMVHQHGISEVQASHEVPPLGKSVSCPEPDCGYLANLGTGLSTHLRFAHNRTKEQARRIVHEINNPAKSAPGALKEPCPVPGCGRHFSSRTGLGRHMAHAHDQRLADTEKADA